MSKKQVKIEGQGKVNLKRDLLRPLKESLPQTFAANDKEFKPEDWKSVKQTLKGFSKDGKVTQQEVVASVAKLPGFSNSERWLTQGSTRNAIDAARYNDYLDKQNNRLSAYTSRQSEMIDSIMGESSRSIASQLDMIRSQADQSLGGFQSMLDMAMSQSQAINSQQRAAFDEANQASEQAIRQYQSQIASLPGFTPIDQIGGESEQVSGWNPLQPIGVERQAATIQRTPAMTGFSSEQMASSSRQRTGIQGFRRRAA